MCDQLRYDCLTNEYVKTPNIDRLRKRGVFFQNGYSQTPVCIPARHSLISGLDAFKIGMCENTLKRREIRYPLAALVRQQGYYTCAVGKMHFVPSREHFGFDKMYLSEEIPRYLQDDEYLQWLREQGYTNILEPHGSRSETYYVPQDSKLPEKYHTTAWTADKTIEVLKKNKVRNFFVFCSFIKPHPPFDPCEPYNHMYDPKTVPLPVQDPQENAWIDNMIWIQNGYKVNGLENVSKEQQQKMRAYYYGSVSQVDTALGKILDYLEESGLDKNTMIVFTADHGEMLGDHGSFGKRTYYEQSCKIPFVFSYPGHFEEGIEVEEFGTLPDVYATILKMTGAQIPKDCDGIDLSGVCKGTEKRVRSQIIAQYGTGHNFKAMVRWDKFKYIYFANGRKEVLYDLEKDPDEIHPITISAFFSEKRKILLKYFKENDFKEGVMGEELIGFDYERPNVGGFLNQFPSWPEYLWEENE